MTVKNVRDIFFTLLNTSVNQQRICENEVNIKNIWEKCQQLTDECGRIDAKLDLNRKQLDKQHTDFYLKFEEHEARNEDDFAMVDEKIKKINEKLVEHRTKHEEHNVQQSKLSRECEKLNRLINKTKE